MMEVSIYKLTLYSGLKVDDKQDLIILPPFKQKDSYLAHFKSIRAAVNSFQSYLSILIKVIAQHDPSILNVPISINQMQAHRSFKVKDKFIKDFKFKEINYGTKKG